MVIQERSVRTRRRLVLAAAAEMYENGYEGATLAKICKSAQMSMGALTFHFSSKRELADAVRADARTITRNRLEQVGLAPSSALPALIRLTVGLAQLLETEVVVRSAARLARDCPSEDGWWGAWLPQVRHLLVEAQRRDELRPGVDLQVMGALVMHLVIGAEVFVRAGSGACEVPSLGAAAQVERMWEVVLRGVATPH